MPGFDRTGSQGCGPTTGRGFGSCRRGRGWSFRGNRGVKAPCGLWNHPSFRNVDIEEQKEYFKDQLQQLEEEKKLLEEKLNGLEKD